MKILLKRRFANALPSSITGLNPYEPLWLVQNGTTQSGTGGKGKLYIASTASTVEGVMMDNMLTTKGDIVYASEAKTPTRLAIGTEGKILGVSNNAPAWVDASAAAGVKNGALVVKKYEDTTSYTAMTANQEGNTDLIFKGGNYTNVSIGSSENGIQVSYNVSLPNTGSATKPIYIDSAGVPTASNATVGSSVRPVYMNAGTITQGAYTFPSTTTTEKKVLVTTTTAGTLAYASALGSTTQPIYIDSNGVLTAGSTYAGGTKVTLNGTAKGSTDASFYAPTTAGTSGQYLKSSGSGAPTWTSIDDDVHRIVGNPMNFKGSIGTSGTSTTVPTSPSQGDTYKIIAGGDSLSFPSGSSSFTPNVGDTVIYKDGTDKWVLIPSGDEPSGTVTSIAMTVPTGLNVTGSPITSSGTLAVSLASGYEIPTTAHMKNFGKVKIGSTNIIADDYNDTLELVAGSNVTLTPDATNDKITINAIDTVYTHPTYTSKTSGLYKITVDGTGHVSAVAAVEKSDITALGIPGSDTNTTYSLSGDTISVSSETATITTTLTPSSGNAQTATHNIVAGSNVSLSSSGNSLTISATDTTYSDATTSVHGLMSTADKTKLDGIASGAEVNQNAFSNVKVGSITVAADSKTDTFELVEGSNVTLSADATTDKITINATDTNDTYTFSTTATTGKFSVTGSGTSHSVSLEEIDGGTW